MHFYFFNEYGNTCTSVLRMRLKQEHSSSFTKLVVNVVRNFVLNFTHDVTEL